MKRFIALVLSLVMALSLCVPAWGADGGYTVADGDITIAVDANGVQTVNGTADAAPVITGADKNKVITVNTAEGQTANFTIKDLTAKRIVIKDSSATITLEGANEIGGSSYSYDPAIHVTGGTLTIKGTGSLKAESNYAAAIGSDQGSSSAPEDMSGTINIEGGTITAKGGYGAAIGAGQYGEMTGAINITGGTVNATGSFGAAFGGGEYGDVTGTIDISAGTVTAKAVFGAAIGTGMSGDLTSAAEINISGGAVSATAEKGAGIGVGGGYVSASETGTVLAGEINISGGDVTAASKDGAGIGAGGGNVDKSATGSSISGAINITAGTVEASSTNGAGIGTGSGTITGGSVPAGTTVSSITGEINVSGGDVTASSTNSNAVGSGSYGEVDSSADVSLSTGNYSGDVSAFVPEGTAAAKVGEEYIIGETNIQEAATTGSKIEVLKGEVTLPNGDTIKEGDEEYTVPTTYTVSFDANGGAAIDPQPVKENATATKPADPTKEGFIFKGWTLNGVAYDFNTAVTGNITLVAVWEAKPTDEPKPPVSTPTDTEKDEITSDVISEDAVKASEITFVEGYEGFNIASATDIDTIFVFSELVVNDTAKAKINAAADGATVLGDYLDINIKVYVDNTHIGYITELPAEVEVVIPANMLPEFPSYNSSYYTREYYVIRLHDGVAMRLDAEMVNDGLSFKSKLFSTYAVAYEDVYTGGWGGYYPVVGGTTTTPDKTVTSPDTFDAGIGLYIGMSIAAAAGSAVIMGKKRED